LALIVISAILEGAKGQISGFNIEPLIEALRTIGFIVAAMTGIVLVAIGIVTAVRGETSDKK